MLRRKRLSFIVFGLLIVLAAGWAGTPLLGYTLAASPTEAASALAGVWHGFIDIPGQRLDVKIVFSESSPGEWGGVIDIPVQGAFGLRLHPVQFEGGQVQFAFVDIPAAVQALLSTDGRSMEGVFHQSGMNFPFQAEKEALSDEDDSIGAASAGQPTPSAGPGTDRSSPAPVDDSTAALLDDVRAFIEHTLTVWGVPGAAVAVVQDGQVMMAEGFGLRDVERALPVTPTTLFGIGSSTKAFTSTAFQMLVDEGLLSWDKPLREALPGFRLQDPFAREHATALDFALHRSGLPRHDLLWIANPALDVDKVIANAELLQPAAEFREAWIYNNFGYVLLGHLIEQAAGLPWYEVVSERLLQPLGMNMTNFSVEALQGTGDYALAYAPDEDGPELVPLAELGGAAPAGAINSNAVDMAKWLLFQLEGGRVGERQLVSSAGMAWLHTPHIVVGGGQDPDINFLSYSPGWMIDSYRGHYRVHHGGNTIGYSADVAFIPAKNVGVAVLTNGVFTPVPTVVVHHVLDLLLGLEPIDWSGRLQEAEAMQTAVLQQSAPEGEAGRRAGTTPSHDLEEYAGTYEHPLYGTLQIAASGDGLTVTYYELEAALEHWHFDQFRARLSPYLPLDFPFVFETDGAGEIAKVHAGLEPSVDPIPFVRRAEAALTDRAYLQRFVGGYDLMGAAVVEVSFRGDDLILTVPGQPPYVLAPVRDGQFVLRDHDGFAVHFTYDADGAVVKALLIQPHGNVDLPRK